MKSLLAAALAGVAALAAAPAAQANWITGKGNLPLMRSDSVCPDAMDFQFATYVPSVQAHLLDLADAREAGVKIGGGLAPNATLPPPPPITLQGLGVWIENPDETIDPNPVVAPSDVSVPFRPLRIEPLAVLWPGFPGQLTHSIQLSLRFNRWLAPGTRVRVAWGNWAPGKPSDTAWSWTVEGLCGTKVVAGPVPPQLAPIGP